MRSFPKGTHTAKHTRRSDDAHDDAARKTPAAADVATEVEEPRGAHSVRSTRDARPARAADAVTRTSSFETADEREAARAARKSEKSEKATCAAASDAGRAKGDTSAKAGAAASASAASASGAEESAPVTFGGRFLLSLRLHVGRRERVEVVRQKKQRRSSFSLTRTVAAVALLVLCLVSTGSTMAYLTYTANAAVNRTTSGAVDIKVVETTSAGTNEFDSGTNTADGGIDGKQVSVKNPEGDNAVDVVVRLSFVPEVEALASDGTTKTGANQFMSETWSAPVQDADNNWILKGEIVTIYLARGWQDNWTYSDGAFYYKKVLKPGETTVTTDESGNSVGLMNGITMTDGQNAADYGTIKVNVFADAIQSTPSSATDPTEGAPGAWNCTVSADGTVTKVTS